MAKRPLPASFFNPPGWTCKLHLSGCKCVKPPACHCGDRDVKTRSRCENQLLPWMLEYNSQAPEQRRLPFEVWKQILGEVVDRRRLAARRERLVRTSRFSPYCDLLDLLRIYEVVNELEYFYEYNTLLS